MDGKKMNFILRGQKVPEAVICSDCWLAGKKMVKRFAWECENCLGTYLEPMPMSEFYARP